MPKEWHPTSGAHVLSIMSKLAERGYVELDDDEPMVITTVVRTAAVCKRCQYMSSIEGYGIHLDVCPMCGNENVERVVREGKDC